jgi:mono/diheme cytochrome c family protein
LLLFVLAGCGGLGGEPKIVSTLPPTTPLPTEVAYPLAPPDIALGAKLFAAHCTECHGANGAGDGALVKSGQIATPPASFLNSDTAQGQTPRDWFDTISNGRIEKLMPPWKTSLSASERWAVALYTYTLSYQPQQIVLGKKVWQAHCAECHGEIGKGDGPKAQTLNRPIGNLLKQSEIVALSDKTMYTIINEGAPPAMPAFADKLTEDERRAAVAYTRTLSLNSAAAVAQSSPSQPATTPEVATTPEPSAPNAAIISTMRGVASGRITNGTAASSVPPNLKVTLLVRNNGSVQQIEATAGADGGFTIKDVPLVDGGDYVAAVVYRDHVFTSDFVKGDTKNPTLNLPVQIYEFTEDASVISITGVVAQVSVTGENLEVREVVRFKNNSDRVFTTTQDLGNSRFASVIVPLPPGAQVISFDDPQRYIVAQDKFSIIDTAPVMPGEDHLAVVVYILPYDGKGAVIEQAVNYALEGQVRLLLYPETLLATSQQLPQRGPETLGAKTYQSYGATLKLKAGDAIHYELKGSAGAAASDVSTATPASGNNLLIALLLIIGGASVLIGLVLFTRARGSRSKQQLIDALVRQIAEIDDQHSAGQLNHDLWHRQRAQLKTRLAELLGEEKSD